MPPRTRLGRCLLRQDAVGVRPLGDGENRLGQKRRDPRAFNALYQQRPTPAEGAVWKSPWIESNRGKTGEIHHDLQRIVVAVDPAATSKKTSDMTGIVVTGMDSQRRGWVLDDRTLRGSPVEWGCAAWDAVLDWNATDGMRSGNGSGFSAVVGGSTNSGWASDASPDRPHPRRRPESQTGREDRKSVV